MAKRKLPEHIPGTVEQWRRRKRREWRAVMKALEVFNVGSAYTPHYRHLYTARLEMEKVTQALKGHWNP